MSEKEIINVDKTHRILVTRAQGDESIDPFIVFTPQRKGLLFWHNYHYHQNKYYKMVSYAISPNDYLTDDVLEATKFTFKEGLESLIESYKNAEPRYGTEFFLKEIISNAEIKNLVIDLKGYVDV